MREGAAYETLCNTTFKKGGEMKKNRLFFSLLIVMTMVISLIPLSVLAQPPLPDNPYQGFPTQPDHGEFLVTSAFEVEVEYPQYWQGNEITIYLEKKEDVTITEHESVIVSIKTSITEGSWWRSWFGLDYALNDPNYPNFQNISIMKHDGTDWVNVNRNEHVDAINSLEVDEQLKITIEPGAPWGPIGFYQDGRHTVRMGFFLEPEDENDHPEFVVSGMDSFDTLNEWVEYDDIRADGLLFVGDSLEIEISSLPIGYDVGNYIVNDEFPGTGTLNTFFKYVRVHTLFCTLEYTGCEVQPIFVGQENDYFDFTMESNQDHTVTFGGEIDVEIGMGFIGYVVELRSEAGEFVTNGNFVYEFTQDYTVIGLWENASPGSKMFGVEAYSEHEEPPLVIVNFDIAEIKGVTIPDVKTYTNLYSTEKEFPVTKEGVGTISFDAGLNLIENADQLARLSDSFSLEKDATTKKLTAKVDTTDLTFLSNIGAYIVFENAMETLGFDDVTAENFLEFIDIEIYDGDTLIEDLSSHIDFDLTTYDPLTDRLVLRVHHFTEYVISAAETDDEITPAFDTVVDVILSRADEFSILLAALQKADLVEALLGDGPFTVVAPTDEAFEDLLKELDITAEELLNHKDLAKVLLYHVVPYRGLVGEITEDTEVETLNDGLTILLTLGSIIINGEATIIEADIEAGNGVVHVIDAVLIPSNFTLESVDDDDELPDTSDQTHLGWFFGLLGLMLILSSFVFKKESRQ